MNTEQKDEITLAEARLKELRELERANGGVLAPEDVVDKARNPKSALHSAFCWDDTEAARLYRIEQARRLIRVTVEYIPASETPVKAFVAVRTERYEEGGYRHMPTLMRTDTGRKSVLETALWELEAFEKKYAGLKELAEVFEAARRVRKVA